MRTTCLLGALAIVLAMGAWRPAAAQPSAFEVSLNLARTAIQPGEAVTFTIRVRNLSGQAITVNFASTQQYDLVLRSEAAVIGRLSTQRGAMPAFTQRSWQPNETVVYTDSWVPQSSLLPSATVGGQVQLLSPDVYTIYAELNTLDIRPTSAPRPLIVGGAIALPPGCTLLPKPFPASLPANIVAETIEPRLNLRALWRYSPTTNRYALYTTDVLVPIDLVQINAGDRLLICMREAGSIITPSA